jgi:hypothetical protein
MSNADGGNAFPVAEYDHMALQPSTVDEHKRQLLGMSLRDYFAAKALSTASAFPSSDVQHWDATEFATHAYAIADAMLAARNA